MNIEGKLEGLERIYFDNQYCARLAGLDYSNGPAPGIKRIKNGKSFRYFNSSGRPLKLSRLPKYCQSLAIPPAWKDVWISSNPDSHLLATGIDDRGRKQYLYHQRWRQIRELINFYRVLLLAVSLPRLRRSVHRNLQLPGLRKRKIIALILKIMMKEPIRIGNDIYSDTNNTYGLTTFEKRHLLVSGKTITFNYIGKSGKKHCKSLRDPVAVSLIRDLLNVRGKRVFKYQNYRGQFVDIKSDDVNEYLRRVSGFRISAKDFRTWMGTLEAFLYFQEEPPPETKKETRVKINTAADITADTLDNTRTMAKKSYIHPRLLESVEDKSFYRIEPLTAAKVSQIHLRLTKKEKELLSFLNYFLEDDLAQIKSGRLE